MCIMMMEYIRNEEHYSKVLKSLTDVKRELWIATSDIKDIYMRDGIPLLGKLAELIERGVCVRLIHAKEPGVNFRNDFDVIQFWLRCLKGFYAHEFISSS